MTAEQIFLAYQFSGIGLATLNEIIPKVFAWLDEQTEDDVFCSLNFEDHFRTNECNNDEILDFCIKELKKRKVFVCFINNEEPSEGMSRELKESMECDHSRILLIRRGLDFPEFREACQIVVEFDDVDSLIKHSHVM